MKDQKSTLSLLKMTTLPVLLTMTAVVILGLLAFLLNSTPVLGM